MKTSSQFEKWAAGFLGLVCVALILNMVFRSGTRAGGARATAQSAAAAARTRGGPAAATKADELARYDPQVRLDLLKEIQERPLPKLARDPFQFVAQAAPPTQPKDVTPAAPAAPPRPPPPPLKAVGVTQKGGGVSEAIISDDQEIYIVHEGETFAKRFRVLKISPSHVEIDDETTHNTIRLPIAP
jgi:hypothetical protein